MAAFSNNLPPGVTPDDIENHDGQYQCVGCGQWFRQQEDEIHCPRCQHAEDDED